MHRILLVEDERQIASFVQKGLQEEGYVVSWAQTCEDGAQRARTEPFDAVLLDLRLPDGSGLDLCRQIRQRDPALPVLMLTALDDVKDRVDGLHAGADDYLAKPFAFEELVARVRALLRRAAIAPPDASHRDGPLHLDPGSRVASCYGRALDLTATEFDLLAYFLARPKQALSRDEIHRDVWRQDFDRGTNLIDVYVGYLRRKLAEAECPGTIETVRGVGYRYAPADTHG